MDFVLCEFSYCCVFYWDLLKEDQLVDIGSSSYSSGLAERLCENDYIGMEGQVWDGSTGEPNRKCHETEVDQDNRTESGDGIQDAA